MRFEEQVTVLCGRALAAVDDSEAQEALAELRRILHQHILQLRSGLIAAYTTPKISQTALNGHETTTVALWRQMVHEIANENDHQKALHLSVKLRRLLRETVNLGM
jgi:hypothetical protein